MLPNLKEEKRLWRKGYTVIGVDEVGRGAFAGSLAVGAVVFTPTTNNERTNYLLSLGINDSKKLSPRKRKKLAKIIKEASPFYSIAKVGVGVINKVGVGRATQIGIRKAVGDIRKKLDSRRLFLLVDAFYVRYVRGVGLINQKGIVHGDEKSLSIAAASIIAKVERDALMRRLAKKYPNYRWRKNKGYGTAEHRFAIKRFGKTKLHREAFIRNIT